MKNRILIPLLIIGALAAFFSFRYGGGDDAKTTDSRQVLIMQTIMKAIKEGHYAPRDVNDTFSNRVYNKIIDQLDYEKKFFTKEDMNRLGKYRYQIDDEINSGSLEFYDTLSAVFNRRVINADSFYKDAMREPFSFNGNDSIQLSGEQSEYAANDADLKQRWYQYTKYRVLAKYVDLQNEQDKKKDDKNNKNADKPKTNAELETEARKEVSKNLDYYFKRLVKIKDDDRFALFMNAITNSEDPHTDYFPPIEKQNFDEQMSGTFSGIGARLRPDGDKIKVESIVTGSPCWKQGELKAGDEILKVAQGDKTPVDVEGYDLEDVVQLIRGPKGTVVRLTVKHLSGAVKVIPITRGEVELEDVFAKSSIIKSPDGLIGYIYLHEFYSDFLHNNGRRCSEDVAKEVDKLKNAGVKGIILDLRDNGGGSLSDVVDMAGIFVGPGPVVQVKSSDAPPAVLDNRTKETYDGPMAIMVNENSASASEIMAAAMQDYKRAVIVGSRTYGKGTVQKVIPLDEFVDPVTRMHLAQNSQAASGGISGNNGSIGSLKITVQKFYRIDGGSTQLRGVSPDVKLPDPYEYLDDGERHDVAALKWDEIAPATYNTFPNPPNVAQLSTLSQSRVAANPTFQLIEQTALRVKQQQENDKYSLNYEGYKKQLAETEQISKKLEDLQKKITPFEITNPKEDMARIDEDSASIAKNKEWLNGMKKDIDIAETVNVVDDMIKDNMKLNSAVGSK